MTKDEAFTALLLEFGAINNPLQDSSHLVLTAIWERIDTYNEKGAEVCLTAYIAWLRENNL